MIRVRTERLGSTISNIAGILNPPPPLALSAATARGAKPAAPGVQAMKRSNALREDRKTVTIAAASSWCSPSVGFRGVDPYVTAYQTTSARLSSGRDSLAKEMVQVSMAQTNPQPPAQPGYTRWT